MPQSRRQMPAPATAFARPDQAQTPSVIPEIEAITERMRTFVAAGEIVGAVTWIGTPERILHHSCVGLADLASQRPMAPDTVFWIASMTKPVTATAVMMLQDAGLLSVADPVAKHLPEFRDLKDQAGREISITIRQCLTHSTGLSEVSPDETADISTLAGLIPRIAAKPVRFRPGSKWEYCQTGIDTTARIVEVLSGMTFPEFLQERLFGPLGMTDTSFHPTAEMLGRLATPYRRTADGGFETAPFAILGEKPLTDRSRLPLPHGGLFSTAGDYGRFARMILNDGGLDGRRYLSAAAVREMSSVQSGGLRTGFTPGNGWGLGWCVIRKPQGVTATLSPGTFGHGGMFGTQAWLDPVTKRAHLLLIQRADFLNADASEVRKALHESAAQHL